MYVHKYVSVFFFEQKDVSHGWFKMISSLFYNHNTNLYNKFKFLEN